jgi:DNA-binding NtrC family response regulator
MPRILLVEDDPELLKLFADLLADASHEVDTAGTVAAGRGLMNCRDYDLLVTDGRLPDGLGTVLVDIARTRDIPALLITGHAFEFLRYKPHGDVTNYTLLQKPLRPHQFLTAVGRALAT